MLPVDCLLYSLDLTIFLYLADPVFQELLHLHVVKSRLLHLELISLWFYSYYLMFPA